MPIFEFRCLECTNLFEKILLGSDEEAAIECPECRSMSFERVVSRTSHVMGMGAGGSKPQITSKSCSSGNSCMSFDIPGPTKP
jgi:putative FmdB family regulatory protein